MATEDFDDRDLTPDEDALCNAFAGACDNLGFPADGMRVGISVDVEPHVTVATLVVCGVTIENRSMPGPFQAEAVAAVLAKQFVDHQLSSVEA